ncbi:DUF6377 domain-containing protein [Massilibacteroides sp.]|uniref:DUF6377 domain-containing protein n=1 Tax=Massilibacteroides sp. TaxID=2034766 RepID=UPI002627A542|nr:DUF6377 domain-containing protein [Massilibacteroides sp.]MDD4514758.1 DUF6377 domain-containing protein [Massilibacteroides sp.]
MKIRPQSTSLNILLFLLFFSLGINAQKENSSLITELDKIIEKKQDYIDIKEKTIQSHKQLLDMKFLSLEQEFEINDQLYNEYKKFISDSAVCYVIKNIEIAKKLNDSERKNYSDIELAWLYSSRGLYFEAKELLDSIHKPILNQDILARYYEVYGSFCSHYGQSNNQVKYFIKSEYYRDSLLSVLDRDSYSYRLNYGIKLVYNGRLNEAETVLNRLIHDIQQESPEQATVSYFLSLIYKQTGQSGLQEKQLLLSAIADIKNAIKDNASLQELALFYYQNGDINRAYQFIDLAINEALFCNMRYRAIETSSFYPIINASYQTKEEKRKSDLQLFSILISFLTIFALILTIYLYKQMKKLSRIRRQLKDTNEELSKLNTDLNHVNSSLVDANHIKEEYIGHFFDLCSSYIDKLENYRKDLNKLASNKKLEELYNALKSTNFVDSELEELYRSFDSIFLNLYPTFIEEFNKLLLPGEQVTVKQGELLNTELRIFALIRLGITDSDKIASFLRYSLRTVYNYRTKMRNKSAVVRDDFEKKVAEIAAFPSEEN